MKKRGRPDLPLIFLLLAFAEAMHGLVAVYVHTEEVIGGSVKLLFFVVVVKLAVFALASVKMSASEGAFFSVLTFEALAERLLEAAFTVVVAVEVLTEGAAFAAFFVITLEAGTERLAERALFAVFAIEALSEGLTELVAFPFAVLVE